MNNKIFFCFLTIEWNIWAMNNTEFMYLFENCFFFKPHRFYINEKV